GCPSRSVPGLDIEVCVLEQVRDMLHQTTAAATAADTAAAILDDAGAVHARDVLQRAWETLGPSRQARALGLLIERVEYDDSAGQVRICLRPDGVQRLAQDW